MCHGQRNKLRQFNDLQMGLVTRRLSVLKQRLGDVRRTDAHISTFSFS